MELVPCLISYNQDDLYGLKERQEIPRETKINMAEADDRFVYTISGVKVVFPCKAYPTQLSMMNMIIRGIERQQNSLLESPTGSGKSLALLCSCLAWQAAEYEKKAKLEEQMNAALESKDDECCGKTCGGEDKSFPTDPEVVIKSEEIQHNSINCAGRSDIEVPQKTEAVATPMQTTEQNESLVRGNESGSPTDDDFLPAKKRFRTPGNQATPSCKKRRVHTPLGASCEDEADHEPPEWRMELSRDGPGENVSPGAMDGNDNKEKCSVDGSSKGDGKSETLKVPKIFFGTRTHKQIAQISRELRKTEYKRVRMTILSSREHSCVHPIVSKGKNKNEECRKLLDGSAGTTCKYFQKVHTIKSQMSLKCHGLNQAWDVEDLVKLGGQIKACSYYAARELMKEADIIFCPYNYLIDPKIRMQMDISLKDQIVVLDEAHNVEDSAREAASLTLTAVDLQNTLDELDRLVHLQVLTEHHRALHLMVGSFLRWIHESSSQLKERGFEQSSKVWSGMEIIAAMEKQGITPATFKLHSEHFQFVMTSAKDPNRQGMPALSSHGASLLEGVFLVGRFMMENNMQYICDYRCAILKTSVMVRDVHVLPGGWRRSHGGMRKEWTHSLNFWCLNPAVVFSELGSQTRCIVLTSGTLSPMGSFSSELGIKFPIQLEANHVIANSQVWVGTLSTGPSGSAINASFHSSETFTFQDEVGKMVLNVCETVPHGVLCFFPSYNMLDKLSKRWQSTGLWSKLSDRKTVVSEPRGGDKSEFDDIMHQFYHAIRASEDEECTELDSDDESSVDGGLFLAVCRGKVSEGLDFADNNARAVITVGIPFPNVKDVQVELKRKYNTQYAASRGLLTGSEWYEIQAYRALNQALGRCIRHKQDWGAILLIDERFNKSPKYINGISKWLRKRIAQFTNFTMAMSSLKEFTSARKLEPFPSSTSPGSLSQLSRSTVETPAKEESIRTDSKPAVDHAQLGITQVNSFGGFTPKQNVHTDTKPAEEHTQLGKTKVNSFGGFTPRHNVHTDTKPAEEHTQLGKTQVNSFGGFTPRQNVHTDTKPAEEHAQLGKTQVNSFGGFTPRQNVHTDQLNRGTVETPAKTQNVNSDTKPAVEHTPLGKTQLNSNGGFTPGSSVYTDTKPYVEHTPLTKAQRILNGGFTPRKNVRTNIQAFFTCNPEAKTQVNPNGAFTPSVSGHTNVLKPSNAQGNPTVVFTPSQVTNISASGVTSKIAKKNGNVEALKTASADQGKKERKIFNGMTSVVDYFNLTPVKSREPKTDVKVENKASDCAVERNLECETLSDEQLSTSPVLFTTPHSTPSTSPVKQEPNLFTFSQGEDRTGINSSNLNRVIHEPRENKCLGKQDSNAGTYSTDTSKKGDNIIGPSLTRNDTIIEEAKVDNVLEPSLTTADAGNENGVPLRKLFRTRKTAASVTGLENHTEGSREEKKSRDLLDDVKETLAVEKATDQANSLQSAETTLETNSDSKVVASCSKRSRIFSKSVSDEPSNVRQTARRSTRLRRSSSSTGNTKKKQEETKEERQEDDGCEPALSCIHCGSSLVTGAISSRPFAKHVPDTLRSSLLQTVDEKNVLVIDRAACEILNLSPLIELKNDHAPGVKLNSIFAPENDCCYIPQVCRVCQSANGDPRIVGLEVVSFNSSSEKEPIQPNPPKQVWLFPSLVYVVNRRPSSDHD